MTNEEKREVRKLLPWGIVAVVLMLTAVLLSSCSTTKYVEVETIRTEYKDKYCRDSIYLMDSIYVREKGDTVWMERWRTEYRDKWRTDSIFLRDSIQVPYPVEVIKKVEKKLSWWQQLKMNIGLFALGFFGVMLYRKIRRK